jgi:mono/diheme cytochrome c family protein
LFEIFAKRNGMIESSEDMRAFGTTLALVALISVGLAVAAPTRKAVPALATAQEAARNSEAARDTARQPATDEQAVIVHGRWVYRESCARCHGDSGEGRSGCCCKQGPTLVGSALTRWQIRAATSQGMPGMPAFRDRLSDVEIKAVAAYVQRLGAGLPAE